MDAPGPGRWGPTALTAGHRPGRRCERDLCSFPHYRGSLPPAEVHTPRQDLDEHTRLTEQVTPWQAKFPEVAVETLVSHDGAAGVLVGVSQSAQLVIVGSRGHGVIAGTLLGSTGLQLLHHAQCPVLIVRTGHERGETR